MSQLPAPLRELLLLRHAKSDRSDPTWLDFDRPLAERGREDAHTIGRWIQEQRLVPDHIITSPSKRTLQTLKRARTHFDPDNLISCSHDARIYEAPMTDLLASLADSPAQANRVLLVGHNPGLESLMSYLDGQNDTDDTCIEDVKRFPTSALAHFIMPSDWRQLNHGCAKLVNLWLVKTLPTQA
jgi:phosphohistidine phosphatase